MTGGHILVVSAPSGSGKGTVIGKLKTINPKITTSVSYTSRPPRDGEIEGVHYYFVSKERFEALIDEGGFIEWDRYQGDYYGTSKIKSETLLGSDSETDVVFDITIKGAYAIREHYPDATLVFIVPPSMEELEKRLRNRGTESDEKIRGRMAEARSEINAVENFDFCVVNDDAAEAAHTLNSIMTAAKCRVNAETAALTKHILLRD